MSLILSRPDRSLSTRRRTGIPVCAVALLGLSILIVPATNGGTPAYKATYIGASTPFGINNSGEVGTSEYVYDNGAFTPIGLLPGYDTKYVRSGYISNNGWVAATAAQSRTALSQAFVFRDGRLSGLGTLQGYDSSVATGINRDGVVVGFAYNSGLPDNLAFLYSGGKLSALVPPGNTTGSQAVAINDDGQIVVFRWGHPEVFVYSKGIWTPLTSPVGKFAEAAAISANGVVAGDQVDLATGGYRAAVYLDSSWVVLGTLAGDDNSEARGVNSSGQVVGNSWSSGRAKPLPFLYSGGTMWNFNDIVTGLDDGVILSWAYGINDRGQVIVSGNDGTGYYWTQSSPPTTSC